MRRSSPVSKNPKYKREKFSGFQQSKVYSFCVRYNVVVAASDWSNGISMQPQPHAKRVG